MVHDKERDFQRRLKASADAAGIYSENVHPGIGMNAGFPDMVFSIEGLLFPVELKMLKTRQGGFKISGIRPAQLSWMNRCYNRGDLCGLIGDFGELSLALPVLDVLKGKRKFETMALRLKPIDSVMDALEMAKEWRKKERK